MAVFQLSQIIDKIKMFENIRIETIYYHKNVRIWVLINLLFGFKRMQNSPNIELTSLVTKALVTFPPNVE